MNPLAEENTVYMTSLDWPPYSGVELLEQGASVEIATSALANVGLKLVVDFYPWSRAVRLAGAPTSKYIGYLPEYYAQSLDADFYFSNEIGRGPLGFVERTDAPVLWSELSDLKPYTIGVVRDYVNTRAFDALVERGELTVQSVTSDVLNLRKVNAGRIDLAVIDKHVMHYWLERDDKLIQRKASLQFNTKMLADKKLFVCFKRSELGEKVRSLFNQGLAMVDIEVIMQKHFGTGGRHGGNVGESNSGPVLEQLYDIDPQEVLH